MALWIPRGSEILFTCLLLVYIFDWFRSIGIGVKSHLFIFPVYYMLFWISVVLCYILNFWDLHIEMWWRLRFFKRLHEEFEYATLSFIFLEYEWSDRSLTKETNIIGYIFSHIDQTQTDKSALRRIGSSNLTLNLV